MKSQLPTMQFWQKFASPDNIQVRYHPIPDLGYEPAMMFESIRLREENLRERIRDALRVFRLEPGIISMALLYRSLSSAWKK